MSSQLLPSNHLPSKHLVHQGGWFGRRERVLESSPVHEQEEAAEYEAMIRCHGWLLNRPFINLVSRIGLPAAKVLDLGTGVGRIPTELALRHPDWEFWAVDLSEDMLARAHANARQAGVADRIHFVSGSAANVPFASGTFDLVISHFTLHHLDRPEEMLNEAARVARRGGQVIIKDLRRVSRLKAAGLLVFSKHVLRYSPVQLAMYRASLAAALTMAETRELVARSRLATARVRGFRGVDLVITATTAPGPGEASATWYMDRWMRLLSGGGLLLALALGWLIGQGEAAAAALWVSLLAGLVGLWQVSTALTDRCPVYSRMKRLGVVDRGARCAVAPPIRDGVAPISDRQPDTVVAPP